ncbi:T9SS type A sorting domain-containing protein [candidate division WOR-3 bacterium]|nr:T9SS type A sorting domain-containing protein [candidate division WOR-3 bacterium]
MMKSHSRACLVGVVWLALVAPARAQAVAETIGFTTRDRQMYGPAVRYLAFDSLSGTHAVWKDGLGSIRYNFRPRGGAWRWPGAMVVNSLPRTLGSMDVHVDRGSAMLSADHMYRNTRVLTRFADSGPGLGVFSEEQLADDCRYTLVGAANRGYYKFAALSNESLCYRAYSTRIPLGRVGPFPAFNLAVSKQSGRYGFIWAETQGPDRGAFFLKETPNNGQNWFATSRLSDSVPSPRSRSLLSGCGAYDSTSVHVLWDLYDGADVLHSQIWHYAKFPAPSWRLVHDYACPAGTRLGDAALAACRPSLGLNRSRKELYAVWEQFDPDNVDPVTGLCRADIWAARTKDAEYNWGPARRLTFPDNTSKRFPFLSEVVNDTLHLIYFADQVAGFWEQGQGHQTANAVVYLRAPVSLLPSGVRADDALPAPRPALRVCPNPCRDRATIRVFGPSLPSRASPAQLRIFDAAGRQVLSYPLFDSASVIPLSSLSPGLYFGKAAAAGVAATSSFVKSP